MFRKLTLALCALVLMCTPVAAKTLVVAGNCAFPPMEFLTDKKVPTGYSIDYIHEIAKRANLKITFRDVAWDGIFAGLDSGRYDIAANGVEVTHERAQKYDFSTPYGYIRTALIVRGDNTDIQSFEDLKGKHTANSIASTYMTLAEGYGATAAGVDTLDQTIQMVLSGRADATLNAEVSFYDYMNVHPDANLKVVALTDEASKVSLPMRKEERSASLLAAVNQAIAELDAEGELTRISEKYFGKDITKAEQ